MRRQQARRADRGGQEATRPGAPGGTGVSGAEAGWPSLTPQQRALAAEHIGLVGLHLRTRVPTPRQPTRDREYDDLFQEGCVALVRAAARYDPQRDAEFAAYALLRIRGAVHAALHEGFSTIPVPARVAARAKAACRPPPRLSQESLCIVADELAVGPPTGAAPQGDEETIRHALRRRYERAVERALGHLRSRAWRRRNPCAIMARVAAERLLISGKADRTPLRRIAREAGVSSGRACAYERQLRETVAEQFACDVQVPLLIQFAGEDPARFEGVVDRHRGERLVEAELNAFELQFERLERAARASLVYDMIERSAAAVGEVARNLYRMTRSDEGDLVSAVA